MATGQYDDDPIAKQIIGAYQTYRGAPADSAGFNNWLDLAKSGSDPDWYNKLVTGLQGEDKDAPSLVELKHITSDVLPYNSYDVFDPSKLGASDLDKVMLDQWDSYFGSGKTVRPGADIWNVLQNNFGNDFSDYSLGDNFDAMMADPALRQQMFSDAYEQGTFDSSGGGGGGGGGMGSAMGGAGGSSSAGGASGGQPVDAYLNPYLENVLGGALRDLNTQGDKARNDLGDQAFMSGAYGDARHGVESAQLTDDLMKNAADISNTVHAQGYDSGMGWLGQDLDRQLSAAGTNAGLDEQNVQDQLGAIGAGSTLSQNGVNNGLSLANLLQGLSTTQQNNANGALNFDWSQLGNLINVINGTPGQVSTTTNGSSSTPNATWAEILGALAGNSGLFQN